MAGYKTYLTALGFVALAVGGWLTDQMDLAEAVQAFLTGSGLAALRAGINKGPQ